MKTKTVILGMLLFAGTALSAQNETKYGIKSAVIKKETTVMGQKMESTLYFDDYGKKEATELNIKMGNTEKRTLTIAEGKTNVSIDLDGKQGFRMPVPDEPRNYRNLTQEEKEKYDIKEAGEEEIVGKPCHKYTMKITQGDTKFQVTIWIWEGITLKSVASPESGQFTITDEAKEIQENVTIPAEKFMIPEGVTITDEPQQ